MNENIKEIVNIIGNAELSNKCHKECFINTDFDNECTLCRQATALDKAGYRKRSETVKEFAEKLTKGLTKIERAVAELQLESEAFQIINDLAERYGKEEK